MNGLKVKCPLCKTISFETTSRYDPNVTANGGMVKKLVPWEIDWLCASTTLASEMTCPRCGVGQLAPSGRLTVVEEQKTPVETEAAASDGNIIPPAGKPVFICDVCGKEVSSALALSGHKRSHTKKEGNNG
jgi:hypothetical protein